MAYKMGCIIDSISYLFVLELADEDLGDEDVLALESISEISKISEEGGEGEANLQITLIITLKDAMLSLSRVFKIIEVRANIKKLLYTKPIGVLYLIQPNFPIINWRIIGIWRSFSQI